MTRAAISVFVFGIYLSGMGMLLLIVPAQLCALVGLKPPGETMWIRLSGALFLDLAFYCVQAARKEQTSFIHWTTLTRPLTILFLGAFVLLRLESPVILIFGFIDLAFTLWTLIEIRSEKRAASRNLSAN